MNELSTEQQSIETDLRAGEDQAPPGSLSAAPVQARGEGEPPAAKCGKRRVPRSERKGLRKFLPAPVIHIGRLLIMALIIEYLVLPQIAGTRDALHTIGKVEFRFIVLGVVLEIIALCSYAQLTRSVIPREGDPGFWKVFRIQLSTLSVSHVVPGGSAAGSTLGYKLYTDAGIRGTDVGFAVAVQSLGSAVVLNLIFWIAIVVSIPVWGFSAIYGTAAIAGAILVGAFIALVVLFSKGEAIASGVIGRIARRLPMVNEERVIDMFVRLSDRMDTFTKDKKLLAKAIAWASANWLFDAASLYVFVGAFGHWVNIWALLVAYGLANVLASIPLTPGGLGVVEATLTAALVGFDTTAAIATLGVVSYRLVNFWLPIPVGGVAYLSLQVDGVLKAGSWKYRMRRMWDAAWSSFDSGQKQHAESLREGRERAGAAEEREEEPVPG